MTQIYCDNDFSAYSGRVRPGYQSLMRDIGDGRVNAVVAWAPERLHRAPRELEDFLELVERTGCKVETIKAGAWDVSSSHGRLVARMLGAVSRAESERAGERVSRAHQQAKERGLWRGPIPYGLKIGSEPGKPAHDEEQAVVVEGIFERIVRGDALTRIASDLNAAGVRPRRGKLWTHTGVERLILSPALGGLILVEDELRPAAFDGVVSAEQWRQARAALRRRPRGESRRPREKLTLLGGIMTCTEHGFVCFGGGRKSIATYVAAGPGKCNVSITRNSADPFVTQVILARFTRPDARQLFVKPNSQGDASQVQAQDLRQRREEIAELLAEGLLTAATARPKLEAINERLSELESRIEAWSPLGPDSLQDPVATWEKWSITQRREVVRLLFESISIKHVGSKNGPVANPMGRISLRWQNESTQSTVA